MPKAVKIAGKYRAEKLSFLQSVYCLQLVKCPFGLLNTKYLHIIGEAIEVIDICIEFYKAGPDFQALIFDATCMCHHEFEDIQNIYLKELGLSSYDN